MVIALRPCEGVTPRCAVCHDDALDGVHECPECRTLVHVECRDGAGCPTLGCAYGPRRRASEDACGGARSTTLRSRIVALLFAPLLPRLETWLCLGVTSALLAAHLWVSNVGQGHVARVERVRADMRAIGDALELFRRDSGHFSASLTSLWERPAGVSGWNGPYLGDAPRDPWGNEYLCVSIGERSYEVVSYGADGRPGGEDEAEDLSSRTLHDSDVRRHR